MADFHPETTVFLFESTGVDAENQPFFQSEAAKIGWYSSHTTHAFNEQSYQREKRGYIRVNEKAGNLRKCDMMAWKNSSWKWIIARILSVDFVNPNVTEIQYEVDSMQTFIEDIQFKECWIEREMEEYDWVGGHPNLLNNTQPEGLETGLMIRSGVTQSDLTPTQFDAVMLSVYDQEGNDTVSSHLEAGYPTGLNKFTTSLANISYFDTILQTYAEKGRLDGIVGIFIVPRQYSTSSTLYEKEITITPNYTTIDGYEVVNAKCYSAEFFNIELSNRRGNVTSFSLEEVTNLNDVKLKIEAAFDGGTGGMLLYPSTLRTYGSKDRGVIVYNDMQIPFVGDGFKNWLAQNKYGIGAEVASGLGMIVAGGATGNPALAGVGFQKAINSAIKISDKAANPLAMGGQSASSGLSISTGTYGFLVSYVHPQMPNIQAIDEFFSRYGYKTNKLKAPNVNTRPLWNYVKTAGGLVSGPFNYNDKIAIQNQLDNGVTFWHVPAATIGDYSNPAANKG